jgi:hypothetical protein
VAAVDPEGRTIWIANPRRVDGKRFIVRADEKWTAFYSYNQQFAGLPILEFGLETLVLNQNPVPGASHALRNSKVWMVRLSEPSSANTM